MIPKRTKGTQHPTLERNASIVIPKSKGLTLDNAVPENPLKDPTGIVENQPRITTRPSKHTTVDSQYLPYANIMLYASGTRWPVDWYSAHVGLDDELAPLSPGTAPAHQQYIAYRDLFLNVESPLDQSQDDETKEFTVTGSSTIMFQIKANKHDMFVADIGDGTAGLFVVTDSVRLSYTKDAAYRVNYTLVREFSRDKPDEIEDKVIKEYFFDIRLAELNMMPWLTKEDLIKTTELDKLDEQLRRHYITVFWSKTTQGYVVPLQKTPTHDTYHAYFCNFIGLGDIDHPFVSYKNGYLDAEDVYTIWNAIAECCIDELQYTHRKFGIIENAFFKQSTIYRGIYWTMYKNTVYPLGQFDAADRDTFVTDTGYAIKDNIKPIDPDNPEPINNINPNDRMFPEFGETYVFTEAFYEGWNEKCSKLERLTLDMLDNKEINREDVCEVATYIRKTDLLSQYYFIPIILMLIDYTFKSSL